MDAPTPSLAGPSAGPLEQSLAQHHQLHGVQPVFPVPDVPAAADWYCRVLGFEVDFLLGEPAFYGRVKLGDRSWGDPIYLHLQQASADTLPCGETRLHVGHDIDGLHQHVLQAGAEVLSAPSDQDWGLREMTLRAPGGHILVLGAEIGHGDAAEAAAAAPRPAIACYRPKAGQAAGLKAWLVRHGLTLRRLGLASEHAPLRMQAHDGSVIEAFEWSSAQAIADAHRHPEVQALWAELAELADAVPLAALAEAQRSFADFAPWAE